MSFQRLRRCGGLAVAAVCLFTAHLTFAAPPQNSLPDQAKAKVVAHWSAARRAAAIPRDLYLDTRGLAYTKNHRGTLQAYNHGTGSVYALNEASPQPRGKPSGNDDRDPPVITNMDPASEDIIGASYTFSAEITDASGLKSVSFVIQYPNGQTQSFSPSSAGDTWSITLNGFSNGDWHWWVSAKDNASKGGNSRTSEHLAFTVNTGGTPPDPDPDPDPDAGDTIRSAEWTDNGLVQVAAGRIYFEMPANNRKRNRRWNGYVCSGTVVTEGASGRSVILTAAHCVYDDQHNAFARNVMFIPNQAATTGSATDSNCNNDPLGCWIPSFGVVDSKWTDYVFPDNIPWDYAFYVVNDIGAHAGAPRTTQALDVETVGMQMSFTTPSTGDGVPGANSDDFTHALGYSYSEDPNFMYCAEDMTIESSVNWWLASCDLSGGSSGGPWVQKMGAYGDGDGPVISVNSWGYTTSSGMAGPVFSGTSTECVFTMATDTQAEPASLADGEAGIAVVCP